MTTELLQLLERSPDDRFLLYSNLMQNVVKKAKCIKAYIISWSGFLFSLLVSVPLL